MLILLSSGIKFDTNVVLPLPLQPARPNIIFIFLTYKLI
jgi:hypothetical protein